MSTDKKVDSGYLGRVLDGVQLIDTVKTACRLLHPYRDQFDAIAVRGYSGCLVGPTVAMRLRKDLIIVRKPGVDSHSWKEVEGVVSNSYIIIDDQISSGDTIKAIVEAIAKWHPKSALAGIYLYSHPLLCSSTVSRWPCWSIDGAKETFIAAPKVAA